MNFPINIESYEQFERFMKEINKGYCNKCNEIRWGLKCGFPKYNERVECIKCRSVINE